jgi:predicted alpha-1,2-mannosidase
MMFKRPHVLSLAFCLCSLSVLTSTYAAKEKDNIDYVDPFIGTSGYGNVFIGATLPFGFTQVGPDTGVGSGASGYKITKNINGFSQQHISGMGGPLFGHISVMPLTGDLSNPNKLSSTGKSDEIAQPGYYAVKLAPWNVKVELTATRHVALNKHTFPAHSQSRIVVDAGHVLYGTAMDWGSAQPIGGEVNVDVANQEVFGSMEYQGARSGSRKWKVYFSAKFDTPFDSYGTWDDAGATTDASTKRVGSTIGAYLNFKTAEGQVVNSKVAVSYQSLGQARDYIKAETPTWDFNQSLAAARTEWSKALNQITVEGGSDDQRKMFYSALYRLHLTPNDWTGEAPARYGNDTYYENILCMWDTFRTVNPLLTLIQPKVQTGIVNSILSYYQKDGWTGDAHSSWIYEHVQNGSSADIIVADAHVKGLKGIDYQLGYQAIRKNAFVDSDPAAKSRPSKGRFRLNDYRQYGFLSTDVTGVPHEEQKYSKATQAVSRTLEYVYNDYAVLTLAKKYGTPEDVKDLESRLLWYKNLWEKEDGFMRGKTKDGKWYTPFNATKVETGPQYYEGHAWTWSWYVPHDSQGLINLHGGTKPFVDKLTTAVENYYEADNEPGMLQTFLFNHAGRPDLTQKYVRKAMHRFDTTPKGIPGNDDSGTTSGWLIWAMLGIYPNAGQDYYYIASPVFSKATINLPEGKQLVINAKDSSTDNLYVAAAALNGKAWNKSWLQHQDFINGGVLDLSMSVKPTSWGAKNPPPSLSKASE